MDFLVSAFHEISSLPIYRHGWVLFGVLAIIPAIVSVNVLQQSIAQLLLGQGTAKQLVKPILTNFIIVLASVSVIA